MEHEFVEVRERLAILETKMDTTDKELGIIISKLDGIMGHTVRLAKTPLNPRNNERGSE